MRVVAAVLLVLFAWLAQPAGALAHGAATPALVTLDDGDPAPDAAPAGRPCHCPGGCGDDGAVDAGMGACCHLALAAAAPAAPPAPRPSSGRVAAAAGPEGVTSIGPERPPRA